MVLLSVYFCMYMYMRKFMHTHMITPVTGKNLGIRHQANEMHYTLPSTTPSLSGHSGDFPVIAQSCFWMQNVGG